MKSLARAFQSYEKGPAVKDPEFDEAEGKFKRTLKETDALMTNLQNFNKTVASMKSNMANVIKSVQEAFPAGAVPHEVALDATNVLSQFIIQSENFDRALSVLKDYQQQCHACAGAIKDRRTAKEEYEHYSGKAKSLERNRDELDRYKRATEKAEFYGIKLATVTQETLLKLKGLENVKADIFTRALVGFIDAQAHNQVVAPCQNFVDMYRTHTEEPWPDVHEAIRNAVHSNPAPKSDYDEWAPAESASAPVAQAAAPVSPSQSRNLAAKPTVNMVRALYDFTPTRDDELPMKAGDFVVVVNEVDQDWSYGRCAGKEGLFPVSYTERL